MDDRSDLRNLGDQRQTRTRRSAVAGEGHLSPDDVADRFDVPVGTVYDWNHKGTGPRYMKIGRHVRYRLADVIAWENSRLARSDGDAA